MKSCPLKTSRLSAVIVAAALAASIAPATAADWKVVANNGDFMPTSICNPASPNAVSPPCRRFNSYNQPSVSANQVVVFRARSRGGQGLGQPVHGVYIRNMATADPIVKILDRNTNVPQPNNLNSVFVEPPSFPRIDIWSNTVATRGNHQPAWKVLDPVTGEILEQLGTNGIYTNPFGNLITGSSKLGAVPEFSFFAVPDVPDTPFDVFPGAPAVTDGTTIVFKGNYTVNFVGRTGVYYRNLIPAPIPSSAGLLAPAGGTNPVVLIANNTDTYIPGTNTVFGSTSPPSAANHQAVFAGFDNEDNPTKGGIYLATLDNTTKPPLAALASIGEQVPGEARNDTFNRLGESVSFDGRFVAFWGAWGAQTTTLILQCPTQGNAERIVYCNQQYPNGFPVQVPVHQGIFVHDIRTGQTRAVAKAPGQFSDFVYWNFSGLVPGASEGDEDGEPARWRSATFVAVSGLVDNSLTDAIFHTAFKARTGNVANGTYIDPVDGIYLSRGPGASQAIAMVKTGMSGTLLDPEAVYYDETNPSMPPTALPVTEMGIERDGFRGNTLVINAGMGTEEAGWGGIYMTTVADWR